MTCSRKGTDNMTGTVVQNKFGLVDGHCYSLLRAVEVTDDSGNPVKLLNLRNPWGKFEFGGDWSDQSPLWDQNPNLEEELGYVRDTTDGDFWISLTDYCDNFGDVTICSAE